MRFEDALPLVRLRAQAMQDAVPEGTGGIAAILGPRRRAAARGVRGGGARRSARAREPQFAGQVVIAGHRGAVERGMALAKERGAKRAVMLPMSAPSHCSLMRPAAEELRKRLETIEIVRRAVPVVHNRTAAPSGEPADIRRALVEQLDHPVRWIETSSSSPRKACDVSSNAHREGAHRTFQANRGRRGMRRRAGFRHARGGHCRA
jgi:[acyl-carrier-protein] S-malonyltransferase